MSITPATRVLEIGCGEGGNLVPFLELGCSVAGVDLNPGKIEKAKAYLAETLPEAKPQLILQDIYEVGPAAFGGAFDLIIMRDVIEHIHNQERFMAYLKGYLNPGGRIFFGFPPWRMPFGGHQQVCRNKLLSVLPYYHLLPVPVYRGILKAAGEPQKLIDELLEVKATGISIRRFDRIVASEGYVVERQDQYLFNPNYEQKFGLQPRLLPKMLARVPYFKDFYTTCVYALIRKT